MAGRKTLVGYMLGTTALSIVAIAAASTRFLVTALMAAITAGVLLVGLRHRKVASGPKYALVASVVLFATEDALLAVHDIPVGTPTWIAATCALHLIAMVLAAAGLARLTSLGRDPGDNTALLDSCIMALAVALLGWVFLVRPGHIGPSVTTAEWAAAVCVPLGDLALLVIVTVIVIKVRWSRGMPVLLTGFVALMASDTMLTTNLIHGTQQLGYIHAGRWLYLLAVGVVALHPSLTSMRLRQPKLSTQSSPARLVMPAVCALVAPALLGFEAVAGRVEHTLAGSVVAVGVFSLVILRLAGALNRHRWALDNERALRDASGELVAATCADEVEAVVHEAARRILAGSSYQVLFFLGRSRDCVDDHELLGASAGSTVLVESSRLPAAVAEGFTAYRVVMVCPLLDQVQPRQRCFGRLFIGADEPVLQALRDVLEVLASQVALALERIRLGEEVNRRASEEHFRTLVQHLTDVILILDTEHRIRYASPSASSLFGFTDLVGAGLFQILSVEDQPRVMELLNLLESGECRQDEGDWKIDCLGGGTVLVEASMQDLRGDPTVGGIVITLRDVTKRRQLEVDLTHQAFHDSLTGLANRVLFRERTQQAIARTARTGALVGVLFVDLDAFKIINETLGHGIGDRLLVAVGDRLVETLRGQDTVARLSGDEFAILIEDASSPAEADQVADRVLAAFGEPFAVEGHTTVLTACVGIATTAEAVESEDLLRHADLALHVAKRAGKGLWRRYQSALHTAMLERLELRAAIDQAVVDKAFTLHYQPIVDLANGETVGLEALVRWNDPVRGLVPPDQFIGVAEESGQIIAIGAWVLEQAVGAAAEWARNVSGSSSPYISVNASALQFHAPGFVNGVRQQLEVSGLPPTHLMLEITESLLLRDDEQVWSDLKALRDLGVRVAIDDFGTGYSSLSYLRKVPIDVVKIDRSFISSISSSKQQRALVDGIVRLAHTLGLKVVAEGIEEQEDRAVLVDVGCSYGQGYLFSRPMPHADTVQWLKSDRVMAT